MRANATLTASVSSLIKADEQLSHQVGNLQINQNTTLNLEDTPPRPKTLCPQFYNRGHSYPNSCSDLGVNAARRPRGWRSWFWRQVTYKIVYKINDLSNSPLSSLLLINRCSPPPLIQYLSGAKHYTKTHSSIVDSGSSGYFFTKDAPKNNVDPTAPLIQVSTTSEQPMTSASSCDLSILKLPSYFPTNGHVMPGFQENLVGVGSMFDAKCTVIYIKHAVNI